MSNAYKGTRLNEYGTPVSVHTCHACGGEFTLCPAITPDASTRWGGCLATTCTSYDPKRDFDLFFDDPDRWEALQGEGATAERHPTGKYN